MSGGLLGAAGGIIPALAQGLLDRRAAKPGFVRLDYLVFDRPATEERSRTRLGRTEIALDTTLGRRNCAAPGLHFVTCTARYLVASSRLMVACGIVGGRGGGHADRDVMASLGAGLAGCRKAAFEAVPFRSGLPR